MWSAREPEARNTIENDEEMTKTIENDENMMKNEQPAVASHGQVFADSCLLQVGLGELLAPGGVMIGPFGDALLMVERSPFSHVSLLRGGEVSSLMSRGDILPLAGVVPTPGESIHAIISAPVRRIRVLFRKVFGVPLFLGPFVIL
jgi:hypothetical protein